MRESHRIMLLIVIVAFFSKAFDKRSVKVGASLIVVDVCRNMSAIAIKYSASDCCVIVMRIVNRYTLHCRGTTEYNWSFCAVISDVARQSDVLAVIIRAYMRCLRKKDCN